MPRPPKPWYWKARKEWYCTIDGVRHRLGPDKQEATRRFHEILATPPKRTPPTGTIAELEKHFLDWMEQHRAPRTREWYEEEFARVLPKVRWMWADELRPYHIERVFDAHNRSAAQKARGVRAIKRLYNWAIEQGYLDTSPLKGLRSPPVQPRHRILSEEEFARVLGCVPNDRFKDLAQFVWYTGARPQEAVRIEARHLDGANGRAILPPAEAKGKRQPRIIYLPPETLKIVLRNADAHPVGPIFRNTEGRPWTPGSVNCTFARVRAQLGEQFCLYALRHSYATHQLQNRVDPITLAHLLGHSDTSMLAKVYANVGEDVEYMREKAARRG
ncbi:MAG: tyrosine-type recombinase/integrase [Planctomycetota bacterium]